MFGSYMDDVIHLWFEIKDDPCPLLPFFSNPRRFVLLRQRILILLLSFS